MILPLLGKRHSYRLVDEHFVRRLSSYVAIVFVPENVRVQCETVTSIMAGDML